MSDNFTVSNGLWETGSNWSGGAPNAGSVVSLSSSVQSITLSSGATDYSQIVLATGAHTLGTSNTFDILGTLYENEGGPTFSITDYTLELGTAGFVTIEGALTLTGDTVIDAGTLIGSSGTITNSQVTIDTGATLVGIGTLSGATVISYGSFDNSTGEFFVINGSSLTLAQGDASRFDDVTVNGSASSVSTIALTGNATLFVQNNLDVNSGGELISGPSSAVTVDNINVAGEVVLGGKVTSAGNIVGEGGGTISIASGAQVTTNDLTLSKTDTLIVGGTLTTQGFTAGPNDTVVSGGDLTLNQNSGSLGTITVAGGTINTGVSNPSGTINFTGTAGGEVNLSSAGSNVTGITISSFSSNDALVVSTSSSLTTGETLTTKLVGTTLEVMSGTTTLATVDNVTAATGSTIYMTGTVNSTEAIVQSSQSTYSSGSASLGTSGTLSVVTNTSAITLTGATTTLSVYDSLAGSGTFSITNGATLALDNSSGNDSGQTIVFGTLGTSSTPNTLLINDNTTGFGGAITSFGTGDAIELGASVLPTLTSGESVHLSYSGGVLSVAELNGASTVGSTLLTLSGTGLSTASFAALDSTSGLIIETASELNGQTDTFSLTSGTTGAFENPANYTGGTAPGDTLYTGETAAIASGTASVTGTGVTDNGFITVSSGFIDTGSLTGTGSLSVASAASATLTGNTTLGSITDSGTLVLAGTDAVAISVASGGHITLSGSFSDTSTITGAGSLTVAAGVSATLASGSNLAAIADSGTLTATGPLGGTVNMEGNAAHSVLKLAPSTSLVTTAITSFGTGDTIGLAANASFATGTVGLSYNATNDQLVLTDSLTGATDTLQVTLAGGDSASWLQVTDTSGALSLTLCFCAGTAIATPLGAAAVETLNPGDLVMTANGAKPVRWIGQNHVHTRFADPLRNLPIRIAAGALGAGLPQRDLLLSPDHALFLDGVLVQAAALAGLPGITRETVMPETFTYYHVELATHELLFAEGALAESFVDNIDRMHFHNWDARETPEEPIMELPYPRAQSARQLPRALRARFAAAA
jgi:hypothetical protein